MGEIRGFYPSGTKKSLLLFTKNASLIGCKIAMKHILTRMMCFFLAFAYLYNGGSQFPSPCASSACVACGGL
jgi:hypothetical protein